MKKKVATGSALILAVVLTSLLAVIGVAFLLSSRVDSIATSALAENKELNLAVDTVVAKISEQLVVDTPGIIADEYYDYPDSNNPWLASLEPEVDNSFVHFWRKISDIYESPVNSAVGLLDWLDADPADWQEQAYLNENLGAYNLTAQVIAPADPVTGVVSAVDPTSTLDFGGPADADGDGVADSRWIRLPDMTSGKGKPIYAAVRVVDNSAMLNVNTAYRFDPNTADGVVYGLDGSSQLHVNLVGLSFRGGTSDPDGTWLTTVRSGMAEPGDPNYEQDVVWNYAEPNGQHTPFDISDELKLRNRYQINYNLMVSRIEELWDRGFDGPLYVPLQPDDSLEPWFFKANYSSPDPCLYDYRHIATINNMDRIIPPQIVRPGDNWKMLNINEVSSANKNKVFDYLRAGLIDALPPTADMNVVGPQIDASAAQIAANLIDYRDADANVTVIDANTGTVYGFEQPCVYISELAQAFQLLDPNGDPNDPNNIVSAFAIELHKPYWEDNRPADGQWRLSILDTSGFVISDIPIFWSGSNRFHVMRDDPSLLLTVDFSDVNAPNDINEPNGTPQPIDVDANLLIPDTILQLSRFVPDANTWLTVDTAVIPDYNTGWPGPNTLAMGSYSYQRDITLHKCIRRIWDQDIVLPSLGYYIPISNPFDPWPGYLLQAHPANAAFTNVGEIGMLFATSAYSIGSGHTEGVIPLDPDLLPTRLNLADPRFQSLSRYLTVMDPIDYGHPPGETRVKGRININTAPWFVLAQLPWVTPELAQAIVAYRDKMLLRDTLGNDIADYTDRTLTTGSAVLLREAPGFENACELANVTNTAAVASAPAYDIRFYARDPGPAAGDQVGFPDLPQTNPVELVDFDGSPDDFEERDVIFARISNLVTVRSDIFTAYILVRIGRDGPQKRVIAVLDRSEVTPTNTKVKLIALHPVPDPR